MFNIRSLKKRLVKVNVWTQKPNKGLRQENYKEIKQKTQERKLSREIEKRKLTRKPYYRKRGSGTFWKPEIG